MDSAAGAVVVDLILEAVLIVDVIKGVAVGRVHLHGKETKGFRALVFACLIMINGNVNRRGVEVRKLTPKRKLKI